MDGLCKALQNPGAKDHLQVVLAGNARCLSVTSDSQTCVTVNYGLSHLLATESPNATPESVFPKLTIAQAFLIELNGNSSVSRSF